jgi:TetR/AcrR family transcriptional regulator, transcriptional repressor for nem operon
MTDSDTRPGKRERLVNAASELFHSQGVQRTTLAQVAELADVPPGNVYYYFKSFADLVEAAIEQHRDEVRNLLTSLDKRRSPKARLKGLAESWAASADMVAANGCPIGSLWSELNKLHDGTADHAAMMLRELLNFIERQLRELGRRDAAGLAQTMMARIQGAAVLANTLAEPGLLRDEIRRIERWLDDVN